MGIRKYSLTKKDLVDNGYFVEGEKVFKKCNSKRWGYGIKEIKPHIVINKHKYGKEKNYIYVSLRIERLTNGKKQIPIGLHNIVYAWYKGEVPLGYEVDHIDGDSFNNKIDNLELVTREENLKRRKIKGANQWYYINRYDEKSWAKRQQELIDKEENNRLRKELKPKYDLFIKNLKNDIKAAKNSGDKKTWHKLLAEKITFGEYVDKYKESL